MPRHLLTSVILLVCTFMMQGMSQAEAPGNKGFQRGINLSHWYSQMPLDSTTLNRLHTHITTKDLKLIRSLGMDHVRFPVDPYVLLSDDYDGWAEYHRAVTLVLKHDLNVIIDVHASDDFKEGIETDPAARDAFVELWEQLAGLFADTDPSRVWFELHNEPSMPTRQWMPIQERLRAAVREVAPEHTIVLAGGMWSSVDELVQMVPSDDPNVIYNFHFYEPHDFTHQMARWGMPHWMEIRDLPYPTSEEGMKAALSNTNDPKAREEIMDYHQDDWGREKIRREISRAADWARSHGGLTLTCNEFGVYTRVIDTETRAAWIKDTREALEANQIGWSMWDYSGGFRLVQGGKPIPEIVEALGLSGR